MWRCIWAMGVGLVLAQPAWAKLEIVDIHATYGPRGPVRKSLDAVPGDQVHFSYRIRGAHADVDGKVDLVLIVDVRDANGSTLTQKTPVRDVLALGGGDTPGNAFLNLGPQTPPGDYVLKVTVVDNISKETTAFERTVTCKKLEFAIAQLGFFRDKEGKVPGSTTETVGHQLHYRFSVVGFDNAKPQVRITMLMQTLDKDGRALMPKPQRIEAAINDPNVLATATSANFGGFLALNRAGEFQVRFTVINEIDFHKAEITVPLKVLAP